MKEELQGKLVEILTSIQTAAGKASDFAIDQLPDIAQSYVAYGRLWSSVESLLLVGVTAVLLVVAMKFGFLNRSAVHSKGSWNDGEWFASRIFAALAGTAGALLVGCLAMVSMSQTVLVWLAPKVWLLKELARLVK